MAEARVRRVIAVAQEMSRGAAEVKEPIRRRRSVLLKVHNMDGVDLAAFCRAVHPATVCVRPATALSKSRLDVYCPAQDGAWLLCAAAGVLYAVALAGLAAAAAIVWGRK